MDLSCPLISFFETKAERLWIFQITPKVCEETSDKSRDRALYLSSVKTNLPKFDMASKFKGFFFSKFINSHHVFIL